jgi:acylphosphatase
MTSEPVRAHLKVFGHVQGVFFRHQARQRAQSLGLAGWVRNCPDGSVEAVVQGSEDAVEQFVQWAHRGPSGASVDRVDVRREEPDQAAHGFRVVG